MKKDTRPSPRFSVLQAVESWAGPGNKARVPESLEIVRMGEGGQYGANF